MALSKSSRKCKTVGLYSRVKAPFLHLLYWLRKNIAVEGYVIDYRELNLA